MVQSVTTRPSRAGQIVPMFATAIIVSALAADRVWFKKAPPAAEAYHAAIRAAARDIPATFGSWLGQDVPVPVAAVKMLHPNIIVSRRFQNLATGESVSVLLVHVKDARDLLGHYPPVCYPGQGWKVQSVVPVNWSSAGAMINGTQYEFRRDHIGGGSHIAVDNFFVMRGGAICRTIDEVEIAAQDRQRKFFGAAQVQFVHDGHSTLQRRRQCVQELMRVMESTIAAISGEGKA